MNTKVEAVFEAMLRGRAYAVPPPEAEEIVAQRLRLLSIYAKPGMSGELREAFGNAIRLTETCHQFGQHFMSLRTAVLSLSKLSTADLYLSARGYNDAVRRVQPPSPFDEEIRGLRDKVLRVLCDATKGSPRGDEMVFENLDKELSGLSVLDMNMAQCEAALLVEQAKHWRTAFGVLALCAQLGLLCRGMLYSGLIRTLGSQLERQASWARFKEDLADMPVEAMSVIPVIGDVIGKAKLFIEMAVHLIDKEKALEDDAAALIVRQTRAREFVELYTTSMETWVVWAIGLQGAISNMLLRTNKQLAGEVEANFTAAGSDTPPALGDVPAA